MSASFDPAPAATFFRPISTALAIHVRESWSWLLPPHLAALGTSLFGDTFFKDAQGVIHMLDLVAGEVKQIAYCLEEFEFELGREAPRNEWLMVPLASALIAEKSYPSEQQCFAFQTPPLLGGRLEPANVVLWDITKYHSGLSKVVRQIIDLPPGTQVVVR